jgi:hypothetical protein
MDLELNSEGGSGGPTSVAAISSSTRPTGAAIGPRNRAKRLWFARRVLARTVDLDGLDRIRDSDDRRS